MVSLTGAIGKDHIRGAGAGGTIRPRHRRRKRLVEQNKSLEHANISADATAETTILSAETSETTSDHGVRVRKVPPTITNRPAPKTKTGRDRLPKSIVTTQTFPPPESQTPTRQTVSPKKSPSVAAPVSPPPVASIPRRKTPSLWDETIPKERTQQKTIRKNSPASAPALSIPFHEAERFSKPRIKPKPSASRPKPKLGRYSSAPLIKTKETNVVDDVLMDRAFIIRQNLMNFEMQELAAEAEKAAESGLERFVGSTSKFGVEETPPYRPKFIDDGEFVVNEGFGTPSRRRGSFVDTLTHPMEYTPSYFSRKKIPVTALRNFSEIVPNFHDLHNNIRLHLGREGVDLTTLPELHSRPSLIKNDTDETEKEDGEDAASQAPSQTPSQAPSQAPSHAESLSSFSSYAVASLASIKEMIEYVNRPRSSADNTLRTASSTSTVSEQNDAKPSDNLDLAAERKKSINAPHPSTHFKPAAADTNSDSDDSSVEFYGHKSSIDLNHSGSSHASEKVRRNHTKSSWSRSRSNMSRGDRTRKIKSSSVSFEAEKASYQALLDKMNHHTSPNIAGDADQNSCAQSLANTLDPDLLASSSPTSSTKSTTMSNFFSKIGFSRSASTDVRQRPKDVDKENQLFVANFFYTNQASDGASTLKLDIDQREQSRNPFCRYGCGSIPNSACDTATKYADFLFGLFNVGYDQAKKGNAIIDPNATKQTLHPEWMKTWQTKSGRRFYTPPKLSVKHSETHDDDMFCSADSVKLGNECEDTMTCPEVREQMSCPEILNKAGCSPE